MEYLPEDILRIIKDFLPIKTVYVVNKSSFFTHYPKIIENYTIKDAIFKKYIRTIIRNDCSLQLSILLEKNFDKWFNHDKWIYNYSTFPNYAIFIKEDAIKYNSTRCKEIINNSI